MYIRVITSATKSNTRTKKTVKKKNRSKNTVNKPSKKLVKTPHKRNLTRNRTKTTTPTSKPPKSNNKQVNKRYKIKTYTGFPRQDESLPVLQDLLNQGYDTVTFVAHPNACSYCKKRNGMKWRLKKFISNLIYDAPIFERAAHVNAVSNLKVSDSSGRLEDVYVNYTGGLS